MADKLTQKLKKEEFDGDKIRKPQITSLYNVKEVSPSKKNSTKAGFENNGEASHNSTISQSEAYVNLEQRTYAASRVDYEKPSLEAIGTGEGNQTHGLGLYYALRKYVAEGYRTNFL